MVIVAVAAQIAKTSLIRRAVKVLIVLVPVVAACWVIGAMVLTMLFMGGQVPPSAAPAAYGCAVVASAGQSSNTSLDRTQLRNAATIIAVGRQLNVPLFGAVVGIATAMQESGLRALDHGDRDSLGMFQQRAGWGTPAQRMDPAASSRKFFERLLRVPGWQSMPVTVAAQSVQASGFPGAYARWEPMARQVVSDPTLAASTCTSGPGSDGLQATTIAGRDAINAAFPGLTVGCLRHDANAQDHATGRACDFMVTPGSAQGQALADFVQANAAQLHITYVIYRQHIWNVARADEGWRLMEDRGDPNANHVTHVHVSWPETQP